MNELWDIIPGQEKAKNTLSKICESRRVPHAFLFYGEEGIGKFFTAIQFAKILNTNSNPNLPATIIRKISTLQAPYIKLIIPLPRGKGESGEDSATEKLSKDILENISEEIQHKIANPYYKINIDDANTIKINSIREIKKFIITSFDEIPFRFVILIDAHLMNEQGQNALLKNLEEPPEGIIFILITSDKEKLLPTVQSRCWQINFEPLSNQDISESLVKYFSIEKQIVDKVVSFSAGSILKAISLTNCDFDHLLDKTISILRYSLGRKYHLAYNELLSVLQDSNDKSIRVITRLIKSWLNDIVKNKHSISKYFFYGYLDTIVKFNSKFSQIQVNKLFETLDMLENQQDKNLNLNVVCLNLIFEIASISIRK